MGPLGLCPGCTTAWECLVRRRGGCGFWGVKILQSVNRLNSYLITRESLFLGEI